MDDFEKLLNRFPRRIYGLFTVYGLLWFLAALGIWNKIEYGTTIPDGGFYASLTMLAVVTIICASKLCSKDGRRYLFESLRERKRKD